MQHAFDSESLVLSPVHYSLSCDPCPGLDWEVESITLEESLSTTYTLSVDLVCQTWEVDLEALLGADSTLLIHREDISRQLCGVIIDAQRGNRVDDQVRVRLTVVPAVALLAQRRDTRFWQQSSILDIAQEVWGGWLRRYGRSLDAEHLVGKYPPRDYVVQYDESDLDFVARLLESEGVSFHFNHEGDDGVEKLVLEDSIDHRPKVVTVDGVAELELVPERQELHVVESLQELRVRRSCRPSAVSAQRVRWAQSQVPESTHTQNDAPDTRFELEVYRHEARFELGPGRQVELELARQRSDAEVYVGTSNLICLEPGTRFFVSDQGWADKTMELLVIRVRHEGEAPDDARSDRAHRQLFRNSFEAVPLAARWRPPLSTPKPRVPGPLTARVTGPEGVEIHTDEFGRVKVQFEWDRSYGVHDDTSLWIRVAQGWAAGGFGSHFIPRVGMEVVVEFLGGDPDRPLVTGAVHNVDRAPPLELPARKTQTVLRTQSSPGGEGYNELRFEDAAGAEHLSVRAQRDLSGQVLNDESWTVGRDQRRSVDRDRRQQVGRDDSLTVAQDRVAKIDRNSSIEVGGDSSHTTAGDRHQTVAGTDFLETEGHAKRLHGAGLETGIRGLSATKILRSNAGPASLELEVQGSTMTTVEDTVTTHAHAGLTLSSGVEGPTAILGLEDDDASLHADNNATIVGVANALLEGGELAQICQGEAALSISDNKVEIRASEIRLVVGAVTLTISESGVTWKTTAFEVDASSDIRIAGATVTVD